MVEELVERCSKLNIVTGKEDVVDLGEGFEDNNDEKLSLRLVGRVLTDKPLNFDAVKCTFLQVWNLKDGVIIRSMGTNLFIFQFLHWKDRERILAGKSWCFENRLLVLQ